MAHKEFFGIDYDIFYHVHCMNNTWYVCFRFFRLNNKIVYSFEAEITTHREALQVAHTAKMMYQDDCYFKMMRKLRDIEQKKDPDYIPEEERLKNYLKSMTPIIPKKNKS
jgi:hypothetical protein